MKQGVIYLAMKKKRRFSLPIGKKKKSYSINEGWYGRKNITQFVAVRPKTYAVKIQKDEYGNKNS